MPSKTAIRSPRTNFIDLELVLDPNTQLQLSNVGMLENPRFGDLDPVDVDHQVERRNKYSRLRRLVESNSCLLGKVFILKAAIFVETFDVDAGEGGQRKLDDLNLSEGESEFHLPHAWPERLGLGNLIFAAPTTAHKADHRSTSEAFRSRELNLKIPRGDSLKFSAIGFCSGLTASHRTIDVA